MAGQERSCECEDGRMAIQFCGDENRFGACQCATAQDPADDRENTGGTLSTPNGGSQESPLSVSAGDDDVSVDLNTTGGAGGSVAEPLPIGGMPDPLDFLAGALGDEDVGGIPAPVVEVTNECENDTNCPGAQLCGPAGICIEALICTDDIDCIDERYCDQGSCRSPCIDDSGCPDALWCQDGRCIEPSPCVEDSTCPAGRYCLQNECVPACERDSQCAGARQCLGNRCVESDQCFDALDCDEGRVCPADAQLISLVPSRCQDRCDDVVNPCPGNGLICGLDGTCQENADGCANDDECLGERICADGLCADPCPLTACAGSRVCCDESNTDALGCEVGLCPEKSSDCLSNEDCDGERICVRDAGALEGQCHNPCDQNGACAAEEFCDSENNACIPQIACADDSQCGPGEICGDTHCIAAECTPPADGCAGSRVCWEGRCDEPAACLSDADCDSGRACHLFQCRGTCSTDGECPGTQRCSSQGWCEEDEFCSDDDGCLGTRICQGLTCTDRCEVDDDCPEGATCLGSGRCVREESCSTDDDCIGAQICTWTGDCALPNCATDSDCNDAFCVDEVCGVLPYGCTGPETCIDGLACADIHACVPESMCADDNDCPPSASKCGRSGTCYQCLADNHCQGLEVCRNGICELEPERSCDNHNDCPGMRMCSSGRCIADSDCLDDERGGLGRPVEVLNIGHHAGLQWCDSDDQFRIVIPAGQGRTIVLRHPTEDGDLSLSVGPAGRRADSIHFSNRSFGVERVSIPPVETDQEFDIWVSGRAGFPASYALSIEAIQPGECAPDQAEGFLGNDAPGQAAPLHYSANGMAQSIQGTLCPQDIDVFAFYGEPGTLWRLMIATHNDALPGRILDDQGIEVMASQNQDGLSMLNFTPTVRGIYYLEVSPLDPLSTVEYTLTSERLDTDDAVAQMCNAAVLLSPGTRQRVAAEFDRLTSSCGSGADGMAMFELDETTRVDVSLDGLNEPAFSSLSIASSCGDEVQPVSCRFAGANVENILLPKGRWYVLAQASGGGDPHITLNVAARCETSRDCPNFGEVCAHGVCQTLCEADNDCNAGQVCGANGQCEPDGPCTDDSQCTGIQVCESGTCVDFECGQNDECIGELVCIDRQCKAAPAKECTAPQDCASGLCSIHGICLPAAICLNDAQCVAAVPFCDTDRNTCRQCLDDAQCEAGGQCIKGRCTFDGFCGLDDPCPGDQICTDGECLAAAVCELDSFDVLPPVARPATLDQRTYTGLVLCDESTDTYRLNLPPNEGVAITLSYDATMTDLALTLTDLDSDAPPTFSDTPFGVEVLGIDAQPFAQVYEVEVSGAVGRAADYDLSVAALSPGRCAADPLEGLAIDGNQTLDTATSIALDLQSFSLCPGDVDYLAIDVQAGSRLSVEAAFDQAVDGLSVALLNGAGLIVAADNALISNRLRIENYDIDSPGPWYVRLRGATEAVRGTLNFAVETSDNAGELACANAPILVDGVGLRLSDAPSPDRFELSCAGGNIGGFAEHISTFQLNRAATVSLSLESGATSISTGIAIRSACGVETEVECVTGESTLDDIELSPGTYFVITESGRSVSDATLYLTTVASCAAGAPCDVGARCSASEQCISGFCLDGTCAAPIASECGDEPQGCAPLVCNDLDYCSPAPGCTADVDCRAPSALGPIPFCVDQYCVQCVESSHCSLGQVCLDNRCRDADCVVDDDCDPSQLCIDSMCVSAEPCAGDAFDSIPPTTRVTPNMGEDRALLTAMSYSNLIYCSAGPHDIYRVVRPANEAITVLMRHDPNLGDLSLMLEPLDGSHPSLLSDGVTGTERLGIDALDQEQLYTVTVMGSAGSNTPYSIEIYSDGDNRCGLDGAEGVLGNDGPETAYPLTLDGSTTVSLCDGDTDYFRIPLLASQTIAARVNWSYGGENSRLTILHSDGTELAQGSDSIFGFSVPDDGLYFVKLSDVSEASLGALQLGFDDGSSGVSDLDCSAAPVLENRVSTSVDFEAFIDDPRSSCGDQLPMSQDRRGRAYARFSLNEPKQVDLTVNDGLPSTQRVISLQRSCADGAEELFCGVGNIEILNLDAGDYTVVLESSRLPQQRPVLELSARDAPAN